MTNKTDHIAQLLNQAPKVPTSPELSHQIICTALLDSAPGVPASPNLRQSILSATKISQNPVIQTMPQLVPRRANNRFYPGAFAAGLMAASLIFGVWTGLSGIADNLLFAPLELAGLQVNEDEDEFSIYNTIGDLASSENLL